MKLKGIGGEEKVVKVLRECSDGCTITELVERSGVSRSTVRVVLAGLEGRGDISYRNIGMAKVYVVRGGK